MIQDPAVLEPDFLEERSTEPLDKRLDHLASHVGGVQDGLARIVFGQANDAISISTQQAT
jgi:hypothetical protein